MSNANNGRTATLSDIAVLRDDFREDMAALENRVRADIAALDSKLTQIVNHQAHQLAAHDEAITKTRERLIRLESRLWWLVVAAVLGSALPGALERALRWLAAG